MSTSQDRRDSRIGRGLLFATTVLIGFATADSQATIGVPSQQGAAGPDGSGWARVLTVTDNWLVLENEQGQQFPVNLDSVALFVMRWPTSPDRLNGQDLVEVTGINLGTNQVRADHVDVFSGQARGMVTPTYQSIIGNGRVLTPADIERQRLFGRALQYELQVGEEFLPAQLHVVGPPANAAPLQIEIGGNNAVTVVPAGGFSMTQVTAGVPRYVAPGDVAHVVPIPERATPRSLSISELVIYKSIPLDQFGP